MTTVLHVAQPREGGVAAYLVAACLDQLARGWDVTVACPDGGLLADDLARAGVPRLRWPAVRGPGADALAETLRLRGIIDRVRPDVLHLHAAKAGLAGRLGRAPRREPADPIRERPDPQRADPIRDRQPDLDQVLSAAAPGAGPLPAAGWRRRRVPVIFQPHGWSWLAVDGALRRATLAWERAAARRTDLFLCVGHAEAEQGRGQGLSGRFAVVRNGVDLTRFRPATDRDRAEARHTLGLDPVAPLAVCVGRVTRQKGQDVLLAAWPEIRRRRPDAHLALVGDGDLLAGLRARPVPGVTYAGASTDVRPWLAAADLAVFPSRWEGLSLAVLEAFATGRSVVVSDIEGLAETVTPQIGAKVPAEDEKALATAVADRLTNPFLVREEGAAAARHAALFDHRLTLDRLAAETTAVIHGRELATW